MRFKIGRVVEVLTKKKVSFGTWRCAEIVADDGVSYTVRYHCGLGTPKESIHNVNAQDVRPSPPPVIEYTTWTVGDIVEVFDDGYWKVSMIEEVLENDNYYHIHIIGSIDEFRVKKSNIRMRQDWKEGKWILKEKNSGDCEEMDRMITRMRRSHIQHQHCDRDWLLVPHSDSMLKSLKRSSPDFPSSGKDYSECVRKRRAVSKKANADAIAPDCYSFIGNVDVPAHAVDNQDKTTTFRTTNGRNHGEGSSSDKITKPADSVSNVSSVASCCVIGATHDRVLSHSSAGCSQDMDSLCSDAESMNHMRSEEEVPESHYSIREEALKTHDLNFRSYRSILETLYASGPLSWEEEALLTNLRMKFCVSNDEHLMELRRLKCVGGLGLSCY